MARSQTSQPDARLRPPFPGQHQDGTGLASALDQRPEIEAPRHRAAGKLQGQVALITGGDSGIGRAVAVLYAREGADVAIADLPVEQAAGRAAAQSSRPARRPG